MNNVHIRNLVVVYIRYCVNYTAREIVDNKEIIDKSYGITDDLNHTPTICSGSGVNTAGKIHSVLIQIKNLYKMFKYS